MSLEGKVALVTGSSCGIGYAISKELAENRKACVILSSRNLQRSIYAAKRINGQTIGKDLDITQRSSIKSITDYIIREHKHIDILVNNAGYVFDNNIWYKKLHEVNEEEILSVADVDLFGSIRMTQEAIKYMITNSSGGVIINISSTPALFGHTEGFPYSVAKSGLIALTKHIAKEYGFLGIRAYTIALGNISTQATLSAMNEKDKEKGREDSSMKRWGNAEEVAKLVACLVTDDFSYATGNTIVVDGGSFLL